MAESKKIADAYIDPDDKILDPELLDKSILDRMPQPTGWRMLVLTRLLFPFLSGPACALT